MSIFVTEMYHQGETKLLTSMVLSCSFLKCLTEKKVEKWQIWLFSYFCSGDPTLDVSVIAWFVTGMSHQSDTRVVTTLLVIKMSHRKKIYMLDSMRGATFEKWATISLCLIKKLVFMKEFLHFKGLGELWECPNQILNAFLSWKMVLKSKKGWKIAKIELVRKKGNY